MPWAIRFVLVMAGTRQKVIRLPLTGIRLRRRVAARLPAVGALVEVRVAALRVADLRALRRKLGQPPCAWDVRISHRGRSHQAMTCPRWACSCGRTPPPRPARAGRLGRGS